MPSWRAELGFMQPGNREAGIGNGCRLKGAFVWAALDNERVFILCLRVSSALCRNMGGA